MKRLLLSLLLCTSVILAKAQTATLSLTTAPCDSDGVVTATFTALTPPLTVTWHYPTFSVVHTGVATLSDALTGYTGASVYVVATDGTHTATGWMAAAPPFNVAVAVSPIVCPATTGAMNATVTGGTSPYSYNWYDVPPTTVLGTSNPLTGIASGTQAGVLVTDASGCRYGTLWAGDSSFMYSVPAFTVTTATTTASCTNGTASVTGATGTAPYTYLWSNGATTATITGLTMGSYSVNVTDATGCSAPAYVYVPQSITVTPHFTTSPATCTAADGATSVFGSGGVPPYTYLWSNGATTASQSGLSAGALSITITDANGCIGHGSTYISTATPVTATFSSTSSLCTSNTGTASLSIAGGTTPYSVTWYTTPVQTGATATALPPGTHSFHIVDAVGCIRDGAVTVDPVSIIGVSMTGTSATCTLSDGAAAVTASGGLSPYTYAWSTGATTSSISSLPHGGYAVTVTDANSCTRNGYIGIGMTSPVSVGLTGTPASCIFNSDAAVASSPTGGTSPYTYHWNTGATTSSISGVAAGYYHVWVTDATGCVAGNGTNVSYNPAGTACYCTITGTVYNDANNNCVQDPGEAGIPHIQIHCSGRGYTYTDASGNYSFKVPSGSYTISEAIEAYYPLSTCQANDIPVTAVASPGCVQTVNFGNNTLTIHDTRISTWNLNYPVPGNTYMQKSVITNAGTVSESAILSGYKADGQLFAPSFAPGGIFSGSPYWYNTAAGFPTLAPGASLAFNMNYSVPTSIPLGTSVVFKDSVAYMAPISNWTSDYTPWDNVNYFTTVVVSSYDPNFKEVKPKGTGSAGNISYNDSVLEYMVHFQNTGTYDAQNIVVIDTLDADLNWKTLRPVYACSDVKVELSETGVVKFTFNNINLPPTSTEPVNSNGMFTYTIHTKPGLPLGTEFTNSASIYFDYNAPVKTNTTLNTLGIPTGISNVNAGTTGSFTVYPNPASTSFNAIINKDMNEAGTMTVTDITGKTLMVKSVPAQKGNQVITVDASMLTPGVYFVTLGGNGQSQTEKLVIIK